MSIAWVFDPTPASGALSGGLAQAEVFDKDIDTFVREVLQNALDQGRPDRSTVRVSFVLEELSGRSLEDFMVGCDWEGLKPHLESIADLDYVTISPRVRQGLANLRAGGTLRVLRIQDAGTMGLTGDEDDRDSNFNALCRHTLITSGTRRESGGSFGLGKSVLWRFSEFSTVLFYSPLHPDGNRRRYFGRSQLAYHGTEEGEWEGSGWVGLVEQRPNGRRAASVWDAEADDAADLVGLSRSDDDTGTSILIVGFDDPATEIERPIAELCQMFSDSAARWFWPALQAGSLHMEVEGRQHGGEIYHRNVRPTDEVNPFVLADSATGVADDQLRDDGSVIEVAVPFQVPAQRSGSVANPRSAASTTARLRVRLAESGEESHQGTVALRRGTGMVVQYWTPPPSFGVDRPYHASLSIGRANGEEPGDHAAEEFLRASEPVAHNEWTHKTDRIKAEYHGGGRALDLLRAAIGQAIRGALAEKPAENRVGPEALRRLFPLPGAGGGSIAREPYRLSQVAARLEGDEWEFRGMYSQSRQTGRPWQFEVNLALDQESGAKGDSLRIARMATDDGCTAEPRGDWWLIRVPPETSHVRFSGRTESPDGVEGEDLTRVRVVLNVRPAKDADL